MSYEIFNYNSNTTSMNRTEFDHLAHELNWAKTAAIQTAAELLEVGILFTRDLVEPDTEILGTSSSYYKVYRNDDGEIIDLYELNEYVCISEPGDCVQLYTSEVEAGTLIERVESFDKGLELIGEYVNEDKQNGEDSNGFYCISTEDHHQVEREIHSLGNMEIDVIKDSDGRIIDAVRRF